MYGRLLRSNREPEDHFSGQMYDLTFPVYESKMDKDLYRDQPFVKVVSAPRVMLLVYDGPKVQRATTWLLGAIDHIFHYVYTGNKPTWDVIRDARICVPCCSREDLLTPVNSWKMLSAALKDISKQYKARSFTRVMH